MNDRGFAEAAGTVLVVDDEPPMLRALADTIRRRIPELEVMPCSSSVVAANKVEVSDFDVVVTDVVMPAVGGLDLLRIVKDVRPATPVILLTGDQTRDVALEALRGGAYDLIFKPFDSEYLAASLRRALETRRLRREVDFEQARGESLRDANRLKDEFLATVSHELRTPLTPILGWARLLRTAKLDEAMWATAVESIERNALAQTQLVDDLLDVSRIVAGKLRISIQPVNLRSVLIEAIDVVEPLARSKQITIDRSLSDHAPAEIEGDSQRLRQVFWNLLSNAVKFSFLKGTVRVELERDDDCVIVRISDKGCGIQSELLPFVFDRFRQGGESAGRAGLGLGLAIVRHIVDLHGGSVEAISDGEGAGSCFTVRLPASASDALEIAGERLSAPGYVMTASRCLVGAKVLVVEDWNDTRSMLQALLESSGAIVTAVRTLEAALRAFRVVRFDVVLCDIGLGEEAGDGCDFIRYVRSLPAEQNGRVPAIALTALARSEDRARALEAGFQVHLAKPGPPNLPAVLARMIARARRASSSAPPPGPEL
jgi:signal transduction histidine kinase